MLGAGRGDVVTRPILILFSGGVPAGDMKHYTLKVFWCRYPYTSTVASYPHFDFEGAYEILLHTQSPDIFKDPWAHREYEPEMTKRPEVVGTRSAPRKQRDVSEEALKSEGELDGGRQEGGRSEDQLANACIMVPAKPKYRKKSSSPSELLVQSMRAPSGGETGGGRQKFWTRQCVSINSSGSSLLPVES